MKKIELLRWIILIPVTFIVTGISSGVFVFIILEHIKLFGSGPESDIYYTAIFTCFAAVVWLTLSYYLAPRHKKKVLWVSYGLGCIISILFLIEINIRNELHLILAILFTIIVGLITAITLHFGKELLNEIER